MAVQNPKGVILKVSLVEIYIPCPQTKNGILVVVYRYGARTLSQPSHPPPSTYQLVDENLQAIKKDRSYGCFVRLSSHNHGHIAANCPTSCNEHGQGRHAASFGNQNSFGNATKASRQHRTATVLDLSFPCLAHDGLPDLHIRVSNQKHAGATPP